jgi:hypothetical protein
MPKAKEIPVLDEEQEEALDFHLETIERLAKVLGDIDLVQVTKELLLRGYNADILDVFVTELEIRADKDRGKVKSEIEKVKNVEDSEITLKGQNDSKSIST